MNVPPHDYGRSLVETLRLNLIVANPLASFGGARKRSLEMRLRTLTKIPRKSPLALLLPLVAAWLLLPLSGSSRASATFPIDLAGDAPSIPAPAKDVTLADEPTRVTGDVEPPRVLRKVEPGYTKEARNEHVMGVVRLEAIIDENGDVSDIKVLESLPLGLTESAVEALRQWKFEPAQLHGAPVAVYFTVTFKFTLTPDKKLTHPLPEGRVTSHFGERRKLDGETVEFHSGMDLAAPRGTPVLAAADGDVIIATTYDPDRPSAGTLVIIDHGSDLKTFYSHLATLDAATGQHVRAGNVIGTVGNSGVSSGPHLHFEVWSADRPVDPWRFIKE